jgi:hypothetical protein
MKQIDDNILSVINCIFKNREDWQFVTVEQKEKYSFISNRFFSKKFPQHALCLNLKEQDKSVVMDMWFHYMQGKPYPKWFWSKSPKFSKTDLDEKDFKLLMMKLNLNKEDDLVYLVEHYPDVISDELKWYKKKEKNGKE